MEEEQEASDARREAARNSAGNPYRFYCPVGETREFVIVDHEPDFYRMEHAIKVRGHQRADTFVPCLDEFCNCPACAMSDNRPAYFAMYLTIIDLTPYEGKNGTVEFSKKLLVVKPMQQKKIMRFFDRHKTLRGMVIETTRSSDKESANGEMEFIEFMDEEELLEYVYTYDDKEGKSHEVDCSEPFDYEAIMPDMTEQQVRAICGGRPEPGNRGSTNRDLQGDDWDNEPPARRSASRRGAAQDDDQGDDQDAAPAPARRGRAAPAREEAAPAARSRRPATRQPEPDPDDDPEGAPFDADEPEGEEVAPAPRRRAAAAAPAAPARRGRAAPAAEEDAPQRPARDASTVASRRASLRRQG